VKANFPLPLQKSKEVLDGWLATLTISTSIRPHKSGITSMPRLRLHKLPPCFSTFVITTDLYPAVTLQMCC